MTGALLFSEASETAVVTHAGDTTTMERTVTVGSTERVVQVSLTPLDSGYTVVVTAAEVI